MSNFDLRALIHEVAAEFPADLEAVAKEVRRRIPLEATEDALDQALPSIVYRVARTGTGPIQRSSDSQMANDRAGAAKPSRSSKVAALRAYPWERELRQWVSVGADQFKFFGDCTVDDLTYAAETRFRLADATRARGEHMMTAREMLARHGVERVRDLPSDALSELFGRAA